MDTTVTKSGPIFDGRASRAVTDFLDEANRVVAERGVNDVRSRLGQVLENPTGAYASKVTTDRASSEQWLITDQGTVYGPWLEGTSSRNQSTRFRGYQTFRKIRQELQGKAAGIAEPILSRFVNRMGG